MLMAPEWIYLLKVNVGIVLFYAFYKLFCCKDTFFQWRRMALLSFLVISFVYPLLNIQNWVQEQPKMNELVDYYATWLATEDVMVTNEVATLPTPDLMTLFGYLYMLGMGVFFLRFLIQLLSIFRLVWKGTKTEVDGVKVISLDENVNPFSFFGWIFLYFPELREDSRQEILTHELTHVRHRHSLDVIVSELVTIVCWMNPFIWLLKAEIRLNLEYLADNKVAESLCNTKQYQYHLLGLANQNRQTGLYNHFNVSHLKNRIIMMNKKRTRTTGRIKYALFAPLATALLLVSNIETVARTTERIAKDVVNNLTDTEVKVETDAIEQEGPVFQVVEEMPEFPGGMGACMKWMADNIKYPKDAMEKKQEGRVIVQFIVERDGSITHIEVKRSVSPSFDAEAVRVVGTMPKWEPGKQRGKVVRVKYTLPVMFRLNKDTEVKENKEFPNPDEYGIYRVVDEMPEFPGGMGELMKFINSKIVYPAEAHSKNEQGRVIVQFVVEQDGRITNAKVAKSVSPSLDAESIRLVGAMPNWKPGKVKGKAVRCMFTVPVAFRLQ